MFVTACTDFSICFKMYLILFVCEILQRLVPVQANSKDIVYYQRSFLCCSGLFSVTGYLERAKLVAFTVDLSQLCGVKSTNKTQTISFAPQLMLVMDF